jgi:hypothetical protein
MYARMVRVSKRIHKTDMPTVMVGFFFFGKVRLVLVLTAGYYEWTQTAVG